MVSQVQIATTESLKKILIISVSKTTAEPTKAFVRFAVAGAGGVARGFCMHRAINLPPAGPITQRAAHDQYRLCYFSTLSINLVPTAPEDARGCVRARGKTQSMVPTEQWGI